MIEILVLTTTHALAFAAGVAALRQIELIKQQAFDEDLDREKDYEKRNRLAIEAFQNRSVRVAKKRLQNNPETEVYAELRKVIMNRNDKRSGINFSIHAQPGMASVFEVMRGKFNKTKQPAFPKWPAF